MPYYALMLVMAVHMVLMRVMAVNSFLCFVCFTYKFMCCPHQPKYRTIVPFKTLVIYISNCKNAWFPWMVYNFPNLFKVVFRPAMSQAIQQVFSTQDKLLSNDRSL